MLSNTDSERFRTIKSNVRENLKWPITVINMM